MVKTIHDFNFFELFPRYDTRKSFYGKAHVIERGADMYLKSYDTIVCGIVGGKFRRFWGGWSATTGRHINEFARQFAGRTVNKAQWDAMPVEMH